MKHHLRRLASVFELDLRSLALFRIALGCVVLGDLVYRSLELSMFYTDGGVTPRAAAVELFHQAGKWSLHYATGSTLGQTIFFGVAMVFALGLILGWRTRMCTVVSWLLLVSLHHRNGLVLYGGDGLLRLLVFWAMFLPLGARFSVDEALNPDERPPPRFLSMGSVGYVVQACSVYLWTVAVKWHPTWFSEGTATYYALKLDLFSTDLGRWLLDYPAMMKWATWGTLTWEIVGVSLLLIPWRTDLLRTIAVAGFVLFHGVVLGTTMKLAAFPLVSITLWLALLPPGFWTRVHRRWSTESRTGWRIYYDGDCGFCRKTVHILRSFLWLRSTPVRAAQDEPAMAELMERENSWIVVDHEGGQHLRFEALVVAISYSPITWCCAPLLRFAPVAAVGDRVYRWVADHRPLLSGLTRPLVWRSLSMRRSLLGGLFASAIIVYITLWNYGTTTLPGSKNAVPVQVRSVGFVLGLDQYWNLFAPYPSKEDGWFVMPARLGDGSEVDLFRDGGPVSWEAPEDRRGEFTSQRQFSYLINLWRRKHKAHRPYYAKYLCREWADRYPEERRLETFELYFVLEKTPPPGEPATTKRVRIWRQYCHDKPKDWDRGRRLRKPE